MPTSESLFYEVSLVPSAEELKVVVHADAPFSWRQVESGDLTCLPSLQHFEGTRVQSGLGTLVGRDLRAPFAIERPGYGFVAARSDGGFDVALELDGAELWRSTKTPPDASPGDSLFSTFELGKYEAHVLEINGPTGDMSVVAIAPPPAAMERFLAQQALASR